MPTATKTKTLNPYAQRLEETRQFLVKRIGEVEAALQNAEAEAAADDAHYKVDKAGSDVAALQVLKLERQRDRLRQRLDAVEAEMKNADAKWQALTAARDPMHRAEEARDEIMNRAIHQIEALGKTLDELSDANNRAIELLAVAQKAWRACGGIPEQRPLFKSLRWPQGMRGRQRLHFVEINLLDDPTNPMLTTDPGAVTQDQWGQLIDPTLPREGE